MGPIANILVSLLAIIVSYKYFGWTSLFILVGCVLIDIDHYFHYVFWKKDISLIRAFKYANIKKLSVDTLHVFHTVEFWFMMAVLSFFFKFALVTFVGMVLHQFLDSYEWIHSKMPPSRVKTIYGWIFGMHSQSYYFLKDPRNYKTLLKMGYIDPKEAYNSIKG